MKNQTNFFEKFKEFLSKQIGQFLNPKTFLMKFQYKGKEGGQIGKKKIAVGLIFWKFLREEMIQKSAMTTKEIREFLFSFLENEPIIEENKYVKIVAMIESLPTSVWRKILWRENIDFVSFESCLRRLSANQMMAIEDNYYDLYSTQHEPMIPRVFKKSLRDRVKILFGIITVKKLLREKYDMSKRNQSKGAYAFNLLSLDFGFSLYPKGNDDDTKITNQKFTRFLSIKEHINDFIVNQEDGKYWWLYKKARSNYAFFPNKDVQLKDHICPGFWATLITQTIFWIVSPIALIVTGIVINQVGFSTQSLIPLVFALPMILWVLVAFIRLLWNPLKRWAKKSKLLKVVLKVILYGIIIPFLGCLALVAIYKVFIWLGVAITFLSLIFGSFLSVLCILTVIFYIFFLLFCLKADKPLFEYDDIPSFVRFILHFSVAAPIVMLFDKYIVKHVIDFIVYLSKSAWAWYTDNLLLSNWLILSIVFIALFMLFYGLFLRDERRFVMLERIFVWLTRGFFAFTIIVLAIMFYQVGSFDLLIFGIMPALIIALIFLLFGFSILMLDQVNRDNIEKREKAFEFASKIDDGMKKLKYKSLLSSIFKSKWLNAMEENEMWDMIYKIQHLSHIFFPGVPDCRYTFAEALLIRGNSKIIEQLEDREEVITWNSSSHEEKLSMLQMIISGISIDEVIRIFKARKSAKQRFKQNVKNVLRNLYRPFIFVWEKIVWFVTKIQQFFLTLKDIWSLFNERCPYVSRPKRLV